MKQLSEFILESSRALENKREFVIIKPGFLDKRNDIVEYLKNHNVIITAELRKTLTLDEARKIYKVHSKEDFYKDLCNYMASRLYFHGLSSCRFLLQLQEYVCFIFLVIRQRINVL